MYLVWIGWKMLLVKLLFSGEIVGDSVGILVLLIFVVLCMGFFINVFNLKIMLFVVSMYM